MNYQLSLEIEHTTSIQNNFSELKFNTIITVPINEDEHLKATTYIAERLPCFLFLF